MSRNIKPPQPGKPPQQLVQQSMRIEHSGPLPPPAELAEFSKIDPGFPERIMRMAEQEQQHRFELNNAQISAQKQELARADYIARINGRNSWLGLVVSFLVVVAVMTAVVFCAYYHQPWPATILGGGGLAAIIATIVYGSKLKRQQ